MKVPNDLDRVRQKEIQGDHELKTLSFMETSSFLYVPTLNALIFSACNSPFFLPHPLPFSIQDLSLHFLLVNKSKFLFVSVYTKLKYLSKGLLMSFVTPSGMNA